MTENAVKISNLGLPLKAEVVLNLLEGHLDISPLAVDADDFLFGKTDLDREDCQPLAFMVMTDKNDPDLLLLFGFDHHSGLYPSLVYPCPCRSPTDVFPRGQEGGNATQLAIRSQSAWMPGGRTRFAKVSRCSVDLSMASFLRLYYSNSIACSPPT